MVTPPCRSRPSTASLAAMAQTARPRTTRMETRRLTVPGVMGRSGLRALVVAADAALADAGRLAALAAQVVELRAPHLALAHDLHAGHQRRVEREDALDALALHDAPHREGAPQAAALDVDHVADEVLHALLGLLVL